MEEKQLVEHLEIKSLSPDSAFIPPLSDSIDACAKKKARRRRRKFTEIRREVACPLCPRVYASKSSLTNHCRLKHSSLRQIKKSIAENPLTYHSYDKPLTYHSYDKPYNVDERGEGKKGIVTLRKRSSSDAFLHSGIVNIKPQPITIRAKNNIQNKKDMTIPIRSMSSDNLRSIMNKMGHNRGSYPASQNLNFEKLLLPPSTNLNIPPPPPRTSNTSLNNVSNVSEPTPPLQNDILSSRSSPENLSLCSSSDDYISNVNADIVEMILPNFFSGMEDLNMDDLNMDGPGSSSYAMSPKKEVLSGKVGGFSNSPTDLLLSHLLNLNESKIHSNRGQNEMLKSTQEILEDCNNNPSILWGT